MDIDYTKDTTNLAVNPFDFIKSIKIDPRASDWFVDTVQRYCGRVGFTIVPQKSSLYEPESYKSLPLVTQYVPVDESKK